MASQLSMENLFVRAAALQVEYASLEAEVTDLEGKVGPAPTLFTCAEIQKRHAELRRKAGEMGDAGRFLAEQFTALKTLPSPQSLDDLD
ncbi:hypothetical protein C8R45DRAFT_1205440 [Mycena sanguinolenta]|nr:hypothetical protein C8R45DRAFT_1205440 [Mycena sanguinolenta]